MCQFTSLLTEHFDFSLYHVYYDNDFLKILWNLRWERFRDVYYLPSLIGGNLHDWERFLYTNWFFDNSISSDYCLHDTIMQQMNIAIA